MLVTCEHASESSCRDLSDQIAKATLAAMSKSESTPAATPAPPAPPPPADAPVAPAAGTEPPAAAPSN